MQAKERNWRSQRDEWRKEIDRLQEEIEKQQKLLSINLSKSPQTQAELYMQYEVARLTSENLVSKTNFFINDFIEVYYQFQLILSRYFQISTYFFYHNTISHLYKCKNLYINV